MFVLLGACTPHVEQSPPPSPMVVAQFDPGAPVPIVPTPNDLAKNPATGKIVVPIAPTDSPAQREFDTDYLGSLGGFPFETPATATFSGDLDPKSVTSTSVIGLDLTTNAPVVLAPVFVPGQHAIVVPPPNGGWTRAHQYAIAIVGGVNGVRGAAGEPVVASPTFALVESPNSLVTCTDLTATNCAPTIDIIPSDKPDPVDRAADQSAKAVALERIRRGLAPVIDGLSARGVSRDVLALVWAFSVLDAAEVTFDPASSVVPFPNDALRPNGKVTLPNPRTGAPLTSADCLAPTDAQVQLTCGLNTLDGFSTLAPPISETSDTLGALEQGFIDPGSLGPATAALVPAASKLAQGLRTPPQFTPCVGCLSSPDASGNPQTGPEQLQWRLDAPLDEITTYLGYVTTDLKDKTGKSVVPTPSTALLRSKSPLADGGHSLVNVLTDAQANQLEPLRAALAPALDALEAAGVPRTKLALVFGFTTQSEGTTLESLAAYPASVPSLPATPTFVVDASATAFAAANAQGISLDGVSKFLAAEYVTPVAITGTGGTLDVAHPTIEPVELLIAVPSAPAPAGGYPVVIFNHSITRSRTDLITVASALTKAGQVVVAPDILFHGERTSCTGSSIATQQASDDAACAVPATQKCNGELLAGRCVARDASTRETCTPGPAGDATCGAAGHGRCLAADGKCEGGDFARDATGRPLISGWNILNIANLFATRDAFRQGVIDLSTLLRLLKGAGGISIGQAAGITLDPSKLGFLGQSLGGILGALYVGVTPDATNVVLNVSGGALPQIILNAPAFAAEKTAFLGALSAQGIHPGTPAFDRFIATAQWILDPADPANVGWRLTHVANAGRRVLLDFIEGDQTVPNVSNIALVMGANRTFQPTPPNFGCQAPLFCYEFTEQGDGFDATTATPPTRHPFLIRPPTGSAGFGLTTKVQTQAASFLVGGVLP
jgi:hypothetical protein